jgi:hypothetical protein
MAKEKYNKDDIPALWERENIIVLINQEATYNQALALTNSFQQFNVPIPK